MKNELSKQELIDWVDFLYKDLLNHHVKIGGYFFKFDQLDKFLAKKNSMERKISKVNNEISINEYLKGKNLLKSLTDTLELKNKLLKQQADFVTTKIKAINKFNETIDLPVTYDEMEYVCKQLAYCHDEVEYFKIFLTEELEKLKEEDKNCFFMFINDLLKDVKETLEGKIVSKKVQIVVKPIKVA